MNNQRLDSELIFKIINNVVIKPSDQNNIRIFKELNYFIGLIIEKIKFNKYKKIEILKLLFKIIRIYNIKKEVFKIYNESVVVMSILFILMKERLGIKLGFIFELELDLDFDDLNSCLNEFYKNLINFN